MRIIIPPEKRLEIVEVTVPGELYIPFISRLLGPVKVPQTTMKVPGRVSNTNLTLEDRHLLRVGFQYGFFRLPVPGKLDGFYDLYGVHPIKRDPHSGFLECVLDHFEIVGG